MAAPYVHMKEPSQMAPLTTVVPTSPGLKYSRSLKVFAILQLAFSIVIFLIGSVCVGLRLRWINYYYDDVGCDLGSGVWVGVFGIVSASIGVAATRMANKCLLLAYFVLCIISCLLFAYLMIISPVWASYNAEYLGDNGPVIAAFTVNILMALLAFTNLVTGVLTSSFICANWSCNGGDKQPTVILLQQTNNEQSKNIGVHSVQQEIPAATSGAQMFSNMYNGEPTKY